MGLKNKTAVPASTAQGAKDTATSSLNDSAANILTPLCDAQAEIVGGVQ